MKTMATAGARRLTNAFVRVSLKAADWLHLLLWVVSICYLLLVNLNRAAFRDPTFYGMHATSFVSYHAAVFWSAHLAVLLLTVAVIVRIGTRRRTAPAELLAALFGWGMLLWSLSFAWS
ncbi:hypothetical protein PDM28_00900 [Stenotrophomonas aracearum]|jgi:hypothetical protein|uniref:Uncharacterized protein n=1 Tax=Stenotrophomonas aracearum TaxID=3003272 RepID=A0ABY9YEX5_9GAMM|nr:hypothetical protein [Stenotrophomonas sp. A5588]WNH48923.1 hypothetical protein PDM28_00900 [Stenotrophomonas sp. A5588]